MKDVLVVYKSRYGAVERYAKWIAEKLECEAMPVSQVKTATLLEYRMLIFGGGLYMGRINGISSLTQKISGVGGQNAFCVYSGADRADGRRY